MKKFICTICGYVYEGEQAPDDCPVCHNPKEKFREEPTGQANAAFEGSSMKTEPSLDLNYDKNSKEDKRTEEYSFN